MNIRTRDVYNCKHLYKNTHYNKQFTSLTNNVYKFHTFALGKYSTFTNNDQIFVYILIYKVKNIVYIL